MSLTTQDKEYVRQIVSEEIDSSPVINRMQTNLTSLNTQMTDIKMEVRRNSVLLEQQGEDIKAMSEALHTAITNHGQAKNLETRVDTLESDVKLIKAVIKNQ